MRHLYQQIDEWDDTPLLGDLGDEKPLQADLWDETPLLGGKITSPTDSGLDMTD